MSQEAIELIAWAAAYGAVAIAAAMYFRVQELRHPHDPDRQMKETHVFGCAFWPFAAGMYVLVCIVWAVVSFFDEICKRIASSFGDRP